MRTIFGKVVKTYEALENGIVIGKSVSPINQSGSRIIHLGVNFEKIPSRIDLQAINGIKKAWGRPAPSFLLSLFLPPKPSK